MSAVTISSASDFKDLMTGVYGYGSSGDKLEVTLDADIDMASTPAFNPGNHTWYMDFDGGGHRIKNLSYNDTVDYYFINTLNGTMRDVIFEAVNISARRVYFLISSSANGLFKNVLVSGSIHGSYTPVCVFSKATGCSFKGTVIGDSTKTSVFSDTSYGCTAVLEHVGNGSSVYIFEGSSVLCAAIVDYIQGNGSNNPVFGGGSYCYAVVKSASRNACRITSSSDSATNSRNQMLYDADVAASGNVAITNGAPETTEHLKDTTYMSKVRGFPS